MTKARIVFYLHILVTLVCAALAYQSIEYRLVHQSYPLWLEETSIRFVIVAMAISSLLFPISLAFQTIGRIPNRWAVPLLLEDVWLSGLQLLSISQLPIILW